MIKISNTKAVWAILFISTVFSSVIGMQAYAGYLAHLHGITDSGGQVLGRDFIGSWTTVLLLKDGDISGIYSPAVYTAKLFNLFGVAGQPWTYPPHYLFLLWPFTYISQYKTAYAVWSGFNVAVFAIAVFWRTSLTFTWRWIALCSPAVIMSLLIGQNGLLTAALLIGGFRLLAPRPWLAGILFGLLTFKPQLGILIPFILLALRQYKAIAGAVLTIAFLVLASGLTFGWQSWEGCLGNMWHVQSQVTQLISNRMISVYAAIQMLGLSLSVSRILQVCLTVGLATMLCYRLSRMRQAHWTQWLYLAIPAVYLATPYLFIYDLCALSAAWLLLLGGQGERKTSLLASMVWLALWYMPFFSESLSKNGTVGFPLTPFLLLLAFILAWQETKPEKEKAA